MKISFFIFCCAIASLRDTVVARMKVQHSYGGGVGILDGGIGHLGFGVMSTFPQPEEGLRSLKIGGMASNYLYSTFPATAREANDYCRLSGYRFLAIETLSEQYNIVRLIGDSQPSTRDECGAWEKVWTSGSDEMVERNFIWTSTQQRILYHNWDNVLNNDRDRNCVLIDPSKEFRWFIEQCTDEHYFICEF